MQAITVLGSTGSIGVSTLDVLARHPDRYQVFALSADQQWQLLASQCLQHHPRYAVLNDVEAVHQLTEVLAHHGCRTEVLLGPAALEAIAAHPDTDTVMAAIVGAAGLLPALAAAKTGKKILLANKEALVMAGGLFTRAVCEHGATLLPIDSEHNAIFQCLPFQETGGMANDMDACGVRKILLTASGGPFRNKSLSELAEVTPEQACAHPNWNMGRKISVDSATMLNKGLELIEACWLFNTTPRNIEVVIHPQSIIHSMVEYVDGSVLAQLGNPDMRTPIAHALAWPERIESGVSSLDLVAQGRLDFMAPDYERFPGLRLAEQAALAGATAPAILNAANEVAVAGFLQGQLPFTRIAEIIDAVLQQLPLAEPDTLDVVQSADLQARRLAQQLIGTRER
jgi:1-deoxy-D-xylulose-5-phosphate reductoisomerase